MRKKWKKGLVVTLVLALGLTAMVGCGSNDEGSGEEGLSGDVVIAGSTSVQPLSEVLGEAFAEENDGVTVTVQGGGSGQGIKSIEEGIADIGSLSREVKDEEKDAINKEYTLAKDGVAVVVNKDVTVDDLTMDQIQKIYTGEITNWKDVGGEDAEITVVSREEGSGTRGAFTELTGVLVEDEAGNETDETTDKALVQPSTGAAMETVASTPNSIGYVSLASVDDTVSTVKVEGVEPTAETVLDGTYKISRPFIYVVGEDTSEAVLSYIEFVLSEEGQKIVEENGFIPVK